MDVEYRVQTCRSCGRPIKGRSDKVYCDVDCRNDYHNKTQRESERSILALNRTLRRNRKILKTLCPTGKATIRRTVLQDLGFNFQVFSGIFRSKEYVYYFSYEYGFTPIMQHSNSEGKKVAKVIIIQQQDYMQNFDPWELVTE